MRAIIRKNTNVKQDESMDNKIDQWSNNEGGNKEKKKQKMCWARHKDTKRKLIAFNIQLMIVL